MHDDHITLLEQRVNTALQRVDTKLDNITELLQGLVRLEERQSQVNTKLGEVSIDVTDIDKRLRAVELTLPGLKELRGWVIRGVLAGISMIGASAFHLIFKG
jgi:hypothetical protein